jgi:uncharacterized protein (TIGR00369 family)
MQPTQSATRTRTITWQDPWLTASQLEGRTGLEFLHGIVSGAIPPPPIGVTLGFALIAVEAGRARFRGEPAEYQCNPMGGVHGGWPSTLLDSALGCAVMTTLDAETAYTTSQLSIHLVRAISIETGPVICEGRVIHRGGRVATAEGDVRDAQGRVLAHGTTTCQVFARR